MEAINDSSKLVSQAIGILKVVTGNDNDDEKNLQEGIRLLEDALEKLISSM